MKLLGSSGLILGVLLGCVTIPPMVVIRRSTNEAPNFTRTNSTVRVRLTRAVVQEAIQLLLRQRGAELEDRRDAPNGDIVYFFYGDRQRYTRMVAGGGSFFSESTMVGSWFGVRIHDVDDGVEVQILGKATLNRNPFCSAADVWFSDVNYQCDDNRLREGSAVNALVSCNEEYGVVNSVFVQLRELADRVAAEAPAAAATPAVPVDSPAAPAASPHGRPSRHRPRGPQTPRGAGVPTI